MIRGVAMKVYWYNMGLMAEPETEQELAALRLLYESSKRFDLSERRNDEALERNRWIERCRSLAETDTVLST